MIISVTLNPTVDRTLFVDGLRLHDANRALKIETDAGGKGLNVSRIIQAMGGKTTAVAVLAGDTGAFVEGVLHREHVPLLAIRVPGETRMNISVEDFSGKPPTTFNAPGAVVSDTAWNTLLFDCRELANSASWVCLSGSLPPGAPKDAYVQLLNLFRAHGVSVCVDADGEPMLLALDAVPDFVKPNQSEVSRLLGRPVSDLEDALEAAQSLHDRGIRFAMVSMGALGAALVAEGKRFLAESPQIEPKSTIGSGDSTIGGFLASLERGESAADALRWGCAAGAATALSDGTAIGTREDIDRLFSDVQVREIR